MLKFPLVFALPGDVFFCRTIEVAERELEPPDVQNGEYRGYDRDGRQLKLSVVPKEQPWFFGFGKSAVEFVKIESAEDEPTHADELRTAVLDFLGRIDVSTTELEDAPLCEVLLAATAHVQIH